MLLSPTKTELAVSLLELKKIYVHNQYSCSDQLQAVLGRDFCCAPLLVSLGLH